MPGGLDEAIAKLGPRYHAIVVDEGQDFDAGWLVSLDALLFGGREDVLYVFHDPAQSIFRADQIGELGLTEFPLDFNCRNPQPIHDLLEPLALGGLASQARRTDGRPPEFIKADTDAETIEALRVVLHRLVQVEGVVPGSIAVLSGVGLEKSAVWKHRRYGNQVLWNGAVDDAGRLLGLAADEVPEPPPDVVLCDSVRRFKGLERPVIVLLEVPRDDPDRLDRLLYIGASRATQHLVVIAPTAVSRRLAGLTRDRPDCHESARRGASRTLAPVAARERPCVMAGRHSTERPTHTRCVVMGLLSWIVLGLIAGVIADFLMHGGFGLIGSIIVGIVGAVIGGFLASALGVGNVTGLNIGSIVIAVIGACIVLFVVRSFRGRTLTRA